MRHVLKKVGKYFFDISKIVLAVAVITPVVKGSKVSVSALFFAGFLFVAGTVFAYKGGKEDE